MLYLTDLGTSISTYFISIITSFIISRHKVSTFWQTCRIVSIEINTFPSYLLLAVNVTSIIQNGRISSITSLISSDVVVSTYSDTDWRHESIIAAPAWFDDTSVWTSIFIDEVIVITFFFQRIQKTIPAFRFTNTRHSITTKSLLYCAKPAASVSINGVFVVTLFIWVFNSITTSKYATLALKLIAVCAYCTDACLSWNVKISAFETIAVAFE